MLSAWALALPLLLRRVTALFVLVGLALLTDLVAPLRDDPRLGLLLGWVPMLGPATGEDAGVSAGALWRAGGYALAHSLMVLVACGALVPILRTQGRVVDARDGGA